MGSLSSIISNIQNSIPELTSTSITARWHKLAEALSINIDTTLDEFTNTENIINQNIAANNYGKAGYYTAAALSYEDGVDMVVDPMTQNWVYDPVDISKQTIAQAAFDASSMALKVSYVDPATGLLAKLPADVLLRFKAYMTEAGSGGIEIPGLPITIVSIDPNILNAGSFTVTYFGSYSLTNVQANVAQALIDFRDSFAYNGILYLNDIEQYIKDNVPGIRDVTILNPTIDGVAFSGYTSLLSGYFNYSLGMLISYTAI